MWGLGKKSTNRPERALFRELETKRDATVAAPNRQPRGRRLSVALTSVLAVGATAIFLVAGASAVSIGGFLIDGVAPDSSATPFSDPFGSVQELGPKNGSSTKLGVIHDAPLPMLDFTDINSGVDLSGMWLDTKVDGSGDVWLYFAFSREAATTGQVAFEFQQEPLPGACDFTGVSPVQTGALTAAQQALIANCNPWAGRQTGDFLVVFDLQGNSTTLKKRVFNGTAFDAETLVASTVSAAAIAANGLFGEGAINLTDAGIFPPNPTTCLTFANVIASTVTGNSDTADFKDTILQDTSGAGISNCGSIDVVKNTVGGNGTFSFTTSTGTASSYPGFDITTSGGTGHSLKGDLLTGTYGVTESAPPAGWELTGASCKLEDGTTSTGTFTAATRAISGITVRATETTTCTFTNARDTGSLQISKVFDPLTSGFSGSFSIGYDCNDGTAHDGTVSLAAGASTTITGIPTGTSCSVSEATLPTAPPGWTFGTPTLSDSQAPTTDGTVVITAKGSTYTVTVTNTISRDMGYLKLSKAFNALDSGFSGTFSIRYNCGAGDQTVNLVAGASTTVGPFGTGTSCSVSEPTLPTAPTGWTFGTPSVSGSPATITKGDAAAAVEVTVTNTISRDLGSLQISKVFDPSTSGFAGTFAINYDCNDGTAHDGTANLAAGGSTTITGIPTGTSCVVSEPSLPTAPTGWTFGAPTLSDSQAPTTDGTVVITVKGSTYTVTVTNTISRDLGSLQISKVFNPLTSGFSGNFSIGYDCNDGTAHDGTVSLAAGGSETISGIPTGTSCSVSEATLPTAPTGWTFGTPTLSDSQAPTTDGTVEITAKGSTYTVTVTNAISRDTATIQIVKDFKGLDTGNKPVDLRLGAVVKTSGLTADGETTVMTVATGQHTVNEVFTVSGTEGLYDSSYSCKNGEQSIEGATGAGRSVEVTLGKDDAVVCTFVNDRKESAIEVSKQVAPAGEDVEPSDSASLPEPGGQFSFFVTVSNPESNSDDMTITELMDSVYGDIADVENPKLDGTNCDELIGEVLEPGESVECAFIGVFTGNAGDVERDTVTVTATDESGRDREADDSASVELTDVPSKLDVVKTASPTSVQEGTRSIVFTIAITNVAQFSEDDVLVNAVDEITVQSLADDKLGDLDAAGDVVCKVGGVTETWPITIGPGQSIVCTVTRNVTGTPSTPHANTATASGVDDDGNEKSASDDASVTFTPTPATPPPPYVPRSDVTVTKSATSLVTLPQGGGSASITYTVAVRNNGPDAAQNVLVSDAAPVDVTFVSATIGKGSCTTSAKAIDCSISSLAAGESVPLTINATVNATGTKTNVVVVSNTAPADTNPNNNTAQAQTLVVAPITPPAPKPVAKPKPAPEICHTVGVTPKMLKADGKAQKIVVTITQGKKGVAGARVVITGPGLKKTVKSGKKGTVAVILKPGRAGIIKVVILGKKACNTQRIGVVGVFEPPVTG